MSVITLSSADYAGNGHFKKSLGRSILFSDYKVALTNLTYTNSQRNIESTSCLLSLQYPLFTGPNTYTPTIIQIPVREGFYSIEQINQVLQATCIQSNLYLKDPSSGNNIYFIQIAGNLSRNRVELIQYYIPTNTQITAAGWIIPPGCPLVNTGNQMTTMDLAIFGADLRAVLGCGNISSTIPQANSTSAGYITVPFVMELGIVPQVNKYQAFQVCMNLALNDLASESSLMCQVPIQASFSAQGSFVPPALVHLPVRNSFFSEIDVWFLDQNSNRIYILDDPSFTFTFLLERI